MAARQSHGKPPARARRRAPAASFPLEFEAAIEAAGPGGRWSYVEVPAELLAPHEVRGPLAVHGTVEGEPVDAELVPDATGRYCLAIEAGLRRKVGKGPGDKVRLSLEAGAVRRTIEVPDDLAEALTERLRAIFDAWSTVDRERAVKFVEDASDAGARRRRISQVAARVARNEPLS